jgi:hypothetical protein
MFFIAKSAVFVFTGGISGCTFLFVRLPFSYAFRLLVSLE